MMRLCGVVLILCGVVLILCGVVLILCCVFLFLPVWYLAFERGVQMKALTQTAREVVISPPFLERFVFLVSLWCVWFSCLSTGAPTRIYAGGGIYGSATSLPRRHLVSLSSAQPLCAGYVFAPISSLIVATRC
jgi:hypothetical protein